VPRPLLLGHRGDCRSAPENTVEAFELALAHGCDGFEFDVRRTRDGQLIVFHDHKLRRRSIARNTLETLVGVHRGEAFVSFEDVLQQFAGRAYLDIEIKVPGIEGRVTELVRSLDRNRFIVSSFIPQVLIEFKRIAPEVTLGIICDRMRQLARWQSAPADVLICHRKFIRPELVNAVHRVGKKLWAWTVNRPEEMLHCAELGVDGLISDDTKLLGNALHGRS